MHQRRPPLAGLVLVPTLILTDRLPHFPLSRLQPPRSRWGERLLKDDMGDDSSVGTALVRRRLAGRWLGSFRVFKGQDWIATNGHVAGGKRRSLVGCLGVFQMRNNDAVGALCLV